MSSSRCASCIWAAEVRASEPLRCSNAWASAISPSVTRTSSREASSSLRLFVRPSAVHIVPPEQAQFFAHVRDVAFCGRGHEHALAGDASLLFTRVFSETRWDRGSAVGVRLSPEGCLVLGAESPAGSPSGVSGSLGGLSEPAAEEQRAHQ
jgi:TOBE domain